MAERANIFDVKALRDLRGAFIRFGEDAGVALIGPGSRAASVMDQLRRESLPHWKREIRVRSEEVVRANTKLIQQTASDAPRPSVDARLAYEAAKRRVREAEEKYEATQVHIRRLEKEIEQYRVGITAMLTIVRSATPQAIATLDKLASALDAYTAMQLRSVPGKVGEAADGARNNATEQSEGAA